MSYNVSWYEIIQLQHHVLVLHCVNLNEHTDCGYLQFGIISLIMQRRIFSSQAIWTHTLHHLFFIVNSYPTVTEAFTDVSYTKEFVKSSAGQNQGLPWESVAQTAAPLFNHLPTVIKVCFDLMLHCLPHVPGNSPLIVFNMPWYVTLVMRDSQTFDLIHIKLQYNWIEFIFLLFGIWGGATAEGKPLSCLRAGVCIYFSHSATLPSVCEKQRVSGFLTH